MNNIFISRILNSNNKTVTQIISTVPPVTIAAIANSLILDEKNTTDGPYVFDCTIDKGIAKGEIEKYLKSNVKTQGYEEINCSNGTIWFRW
ncbi:hypothetical protein KTC96_24660 (plasmid) [Clostridium estertheticum]|uniref:hypothetical protein n=1 Tax=Clostridium estertheticum TaxID=238834 RepID=UPI001C7CCE9F|nr:hypothetical protein [Clostridium estertheticum]MBX4259720.1 hypothetical protein [Clostridium estertheticum]WLC73307.1 hypothetical protein KTC96_24660 [Clostridium estertheticum]